MSENKQTNKSYDNYLLHIGEIGVDWMFWDVISLKVLSGISEVDIGIELFIIKRLLEFPKFFQSISSFESLRMFCVIFREFLLFEKCFLADRCQNLKIFMRILIIVFDIYSEFYRCIFDSFPLH